MIFDLAIVDAETATATGEKFDLPRVLDAMIGFTRAFVGRILELKGKVPGIGQPRFRSLFDDRAGMVPLDEGGYARFRKEAEAFVGQIDATCVDARVDVGPFSLRLRPFGNENLYLAGGGRITLTDGAPWQGLDPTPLIHFWSSGQRPFLGESGQGALRQLVPQLAPAGARYHGEPTPRLLFPHRRFGAGTGPLRIELIATQ